MTEQGKRLGEFGGSRDVTVQGYLDAERVRKEREELFQSDPNNPNQLGLIAEEIHIRYRLVKVNIFEIGRLLAAAKEILPHGEYQKWVEENCDFPYPTAYKYRTVYYAFLGRAELVNEFLRVELYQLSADGFDKASREKIIHSVGKLDGVDKKAKKNLIKKMTSGEIEPDDPEIQQLIKKQKERESKEARLLKHHDQVDERIAFERSVLAHLKKSADRAWPELDGEVWLTEDQAKEVESIVEEMVTVVGSLKPQYRVLVES